MTVNSRKSPKFLSMILAIAMVFSLVMPMSAFAADDVAIKTAAIAGVTVPVKGQIPATTATATAEYTATISWAPVAATFAADTAYTATIKIAPNAGYTLTGVAKDFFTVAGATATNAADSGTVTAVFGKTAKDDMKITTAAIAGVTAPVKGAAPVSTIADTAQYTAKIAWSGTPANFAADTAYTATITITPKTGYTLTGVTKDFFTVVGAQATNDAGSGVVKAVFPNTAKETTYTVTFNSNGGSAVAPIANIAKDGKITLPAAPTKAGFTFGGWNTKADGTGTAFDATTAVTANVTVYAKWTAIPGHVVNITTKNTLLVGKYAFAIDDANYTLNNYLKAAQTAYDSEKGTNKSAQYHIYYYTGSVWYDLVANPTLDSKKAIQDLNEINGKGMFEYMNMKDVITH